MARRRVRRDPSRRTGPTIVERSATASSPSMSPGAPVVCSMLPPMCATARQSAMRPRSCRAVHRTGLGSGDRAAGRRCVGGVPELPGRRLPEGSVPVPVKETPPGAGPRAGAPACTGPTVTLHVDWWYRHQPIRGATLSKSSASSSRVALRMTSDAAPTIWPQCRPRHEGAHDGARRGGAQPWVDHRPRSCSRPWVVPSRGHSGRALHSVDLAGPGRSAVIPDVDVHRTVGCLRPSTRFPCPASAPARQASTAMLDAVHRALAAVPDCGIGYGLLRYIYAPTALQLAVQPASDVFFSIPVHRARVPSGDERRHADIDPGMPVRDVQPGLGHALELAHIAWTGLLPDGLVVRHSPARPDHGGGVRRAASRWRSSS